MYLVHPFIWCSVFWVLARFGLKIPEFGHNSGFLAALFFFFFSFFKNVSKITLQNFSQIFEKWKKKYHQNPELWPNSGILRPDFEYTQGPGLIYG